MAGRKKDDGEDGAALWTLVTADVEPLVPPPFIPPPAGGRGEAKQGGGRSIAAPYASTKKTPVFEAAKARDVDRSTLQKLERGQMETQAVLDLHGHGQKAAFVIFQGFILEARRRAYRCVLVITGKGRGGAGVLRQKLPEWVQMPVLRDIVLKAVPARPKDGGGGAFYVFLRRNR